MKFTCTTQTLCKEMNRVCEKVARSWAELLRKQGSVSPTILGSEVCVSKYRSWRKYLAACILHYYLPKETQEDQAFLWYIREDLFRQRHKWGKEKESVALTLLISKPQMILFVQESTIFRDARELFGLLGKEGKEVARSTIVYWREPRRPKRQQRIRGYRDHGSLRPEHQRLPDYSHSYEAIAEQERIEQERRSIRDFAAFLEGGTS